MMNFTEREFSRAVIGDDAMAMFAQLAADSAASLPDRYVGVVVYEGISYPKTFGGFATLVEWFRRERANTNYDYVAAFDKLSPGYLRDRSPIGWSPGPVDIQVGAVAGIFDDIGDWVKHAVSDVASFVHHPPGWFATVFPLFTMENQRYWAKKLGGSTGAKLYDTGVKMIASKYLGPQGPQLLEAYNKVAEDAARGHIDAKQILAKAPQIAKLAAASKKGPEAFRQAVLKTRSSVKVSGAPGAAYNGPHLGETDMSLEHYRNVAIQAVTATHAQNPSPAYGYLRTGYHQKIYLFPQEQDALAWFTDRGQLEPGYDYIAVFKDSDLHAPVVEDVGAELAHEAVGGWFLPLALGLPAGALGGYYYRKWQESHPGKIFPWVSGEGCPCVGGPWVDIVGAQIGPHHRDVEDHRQAWPETRALIESAIAEVQEAAAMGPAAAYVWSLDPPGLPPEGFSPEHHVELTGTTMVVPFSDVEKGLAYMRDRAQAPHVAIALFDRTSPHWPSPVAWTKSTDPAFEPLIAQQIAKHTAPPQVSGGPWVDIVGILPGGPRVSIIGAATEMLRRMGKAAVKEAIAQGMAGQVFGIVRHLDNKWTIKSFRNAADAEDWFELETGDPTLFVYAAYFDKGGPFPPTRLNELFGEAHHAPEKRPLIPREIGTITISP